MITELLVIDADIVPAVLCPVLINSRDQCLVGSVITFPSRKSKSFCRLGTEGNLFESVSVRCRGFERVFDNLERWREVT